MINHKQHYESIVARGLISPTTKDIEFALKAEEELFEWIDSGFDKQEAMDLICVVSNWMIHKGYDIEKEFEKNLEHQIKRND